MTAINQAFIKLFPASSAATTTKGRSATPQADVLEAAVVTSLQQAVESASDRTLYSSPLVRLPDHRFEIPAIGDTLMTEMSVKATYEKHKPALANNLI